MDQFISFWLSSDKNYFFLRLSWYSCEDHKTKSVPKQVLAYILGLQLRKWLTFKRHKKLHSFKWTTLQPKQGYYIYFTLVKNVGGKSIEYLKLCVSTNTVITTEFVLLKCCSIDQVIMIDLHHWRFSHLWMPNDWCDTNRRAVWLISWLSHLIIIWPLGGAQRYSGICWGYVTQMSMNS